MEYISDNGKTERINLRIDSFTKEIIEQAATLDNRSITGFIVECAKIKAEQILEREQLIRLNRNDFTNFIKAISTPPKPNSALKKAAKRYRDLKIESNA